MTNTKATQLDDNPALEAIRARARGANINEQTLLATDYLNHFNEIVMTLEMVPDFPDLLDEAREWRPKSYTEHFRDSAFSEKALAIAAYAHVPERFRTPFEQTIDQINQLVEAVIIRLDGTVAGGNADELRHVATESSRNIQRLLEIASAIIHGSETTMGQAEIDALLGE